MNNNKPIIDDKYVRPSRAAETMKAAQGISQTLYIFGAAGYGKTTLVADFLARRKYCYYSISEADAIQNMLQELETITREMRNGHCSRHQVIVIDDLHLLETAESREQCCKIIDKLAGMNGLWLILISRSPVPRWLKPLYIKYLFAIIDEEKLQLTDKEREAVFEKWDIYMAQDIAEQIWKLSKGYPMFLRVLTIQMKKLKGAREMDSTEYHMAVEESIGLAMQDIQDYLGTYVYEQWNVELQEFLMDISVVERFDLQMAQLVTKKNNVGSLIAQAQETGNFLEKTEENGEEIYYLRELVRQTLLRGLLRKCTQTHINDLYYSAGNAYEIRNDVPAALRMYEKCRNEEGISRLLIQNARKNPGVGHYYELRKYYFALPIEVIRESAELIAGMSMLQSVLMNTEESEMWYQELVQYAKKQTGSRKRMAQARIVYLDIGLPHRGTAHIAELFRNAGALLVRGVSLPEFSVTNNQPSMMNGGKDFCEWSRRDRELAKSIGKAASLVLGSYGKGLVNLALAESIFEKGADNYEVASLANKGRMQAESGGKLEQVFVAVGLLIQLYILNNHMEDAFEMLEGFREQTADVAPQILPNVDTLKIRLLLYMGRSRSAEVAKWIAQAPDEDSGFCTLERFKYMAKVRAYLADGRKEKAVVLLQRMIIYAKKMQRTYIRIQSYILLAIAQFRLENTDWHETLQKAITEAESYHFVRILTREGIALWELLKVGDFTWHDMEYKKQVLSECKYIANIYPDYLSEKREGVVLLSDKALQILRMQAKGLTVQQIAEQLGLSRAGVKYYNQETYKKLNVNGKAAAVCEARNRGLI